MPVGWTRGDNGKRIQLILILFSTALLLNACSIPEPGKCDIHSADGEGMENRKGGTSA